MQQFKQDVQQITQNFFKSYTHLVVRKQEVLINAGEEPKGVFYLLEGTVKMFAVSPAGDLSNLNYFKAGSFFPMTWALAQIPSRYSFETVENCEIYRAPRSAVVDFLHANPEVFHDLTKRLLVGVDGQLRQKELLLRGTAEAKVINELLLLIDRFGNEDGSSIDLSVTHPELAASVGTSRETVTRILTQLKKDGLIDYKSKMISIHSIEKLERRLHPTAGKLDDE